MIMTIRQRLQAEIDRANEATSAADATVHDAITTLIDGYGQGGALNLKVTAYPIGTDITSVSGQNGDIAVLTETAISNWVVSATEPQNPSNGTVWIDVDNLSNATNLSKDNEFNIYPSLCRQFFNGNWTSTEAYIFNNSWVKFSSTIIYLIKDGEMLYNFSLGGNGYWEQASDYIRMRTNDKSTTTVVTAYVPVPLANVMKKIYLQLGWGESSRKTRIPCLGINGTAPTISNADVSALAAYTKLATAQNFGGTFECNIPSGLDASPYVVLAVAGAGGIYGYMEIQNLWLE